MLKKGLLLTALCFVQAVFSQIPIEGKFYKSRRGEPIYMPLGEISFADKVVSFEMGKPAPRKEYTDPEQALGEPNYTRYREPNYVSLGCGGQIVLEFSDNGFIDMDGPDIYIWEVGPSRETFRLEISKDGKEWRDLGKHGGSKTVIDIAPVVADRREIFYFIRLTDLEDVCSGFTPGVDIDAAGTISGVLKIELDADVFFDYDKFFLREDALDEIEKLAEQIAQVGMAEIIVEGHTDGRGSVEYNIHLSQNRADSVLEKLEKELEDKGEYIFETQAFGKSRPIATDETPEGRQQNRRVEIIVVPHRDFYKRPE